MSDFVQKQVERREHLLKFSQGILQGKDGKRLLKKYGESIQNITPHDMIFMEEQQLKMGISATQIKEKIEKVMNVIYEPLRNYKWDKPAEDHALSHFMQENEQLKLILQKMKKNLQKKNLEELNQNLNKLLQIEKHFLRKENILFPYLERVWQNCRPLAVMWSLDDDIRMKLKWLKKLLKKKQDFDSDLYKEIGELFFLMYGMIFKENLVVFPVAMETLSESHWKKIAAQSKEIGYSFIDPPEIHISLEKPENRKKVNLTDFNCETGRLSNMQIESIFNNLPIDITFIDANDEVKYFSNPKDRFFPRSPAIIGRKVQNCHPPESVHMVQKILNSFKTGEKNEASFHIQLKGKFVQIRYFALRKNDKYIGTLEVSQDVTDIRKLNGEKRLLDWD
ncbi:MAG: PAS domain-containing protein [Candidatus Cloacimonetes bacterium]|nr:PAS domain-containing protein [Candidatus Cloacimonadota bacterium]MCF7812967.1 PAS domain-containing protein [Candidatus Cloacimonadota bacterium]MCF7867301.1 PAS domain-containing protein [Candidatus Cloacimonadota bacterium]MCF7882745.1 PAS domain-containing protein [Candidatus Cloacimonadota bacterium]